jgi:hypothetical protein
MNGETATLEMTANAAWSLPAEPCAIVLFGA